MKNMIRWYRQQQKRDDLSRIELLEVYAVTEAIERTAEKPDGAERLELIRRVYWRRNRVTLNRAAMDVYISYSTARRWHYDFCLLVAEAFGLYDPEEIEIQK